MSRPIKKTIKLTEDELSEVGTILKGRAQSHTSFRNATILKLAHEGKTPSEIASEVKLSRQSIHKVINKYLQHGIASCWADLERSGRPITISDDAKGYVIELACTNPKDLGYKHELWSINLLREYIKNHCSDKGFTELSNVSKSTVWKILNKSKPQNIKYYLERTDDSSTDNVNNVLVLYKAINLAIEHNLKDAYYRVSYDDESLVKRRLSSHAGSLANAQNLTTSRDSEIKRHGSLYLLAAINLISGKVTAVVREHHRSYEFVDFLKLLDKTYAKEKLIKVALDSHRLTCSKETQAFIQSTNSRFEFVMNPKHGAWLNMIEAWFAKVIRILLQSIKVANEKELEYRITECIDLINDCQEAPRWKCQTNEVDV